MSILQIKTARAFQPLLASARYKAAYGGRGSGKSHFFAGLLIENALMWPGLTGSGYRAVCLREVQKSLAQSAKFLIESKLKEFKLGESQGFKVLKDSIRTPNNGVIMFQGMQDHTVDSIKSLEGCHAAWVEEAQSISQYSLDLLRPTIRWEDQASGLKSELWFSWNPRRKSDPVDKLFRINPPSDSIIVKANSYDNPWLPEVMKIERSDCHRDYPDKYGHIWGGEYISIVDGSYYGRYLVDAKREGRISKISHNPLMPVMSFWDIGGTGLKSDATTIWTAQFIGKEVRVLHYYEAVRQPLSVHLDWLRSLPYKVNSCILPHDGVTNDKVHDVSFESYIKQAGFFVDVVKNQGTGAAKHRIEACRKLFPSIWFNEDTTEPGRDALGWYHEKKDETRNLGLGPEHDWSSHGADSFGLMAIYQSNAPTIETKTPEYESPVVY